ncbi:MAG: alpha/beta hydrolase [Candidatus Eisenbacteria bacterium]
MRVSRHAMTGISRAALLVLLSCLSGCEPVIALGVRLLYRRAELPAAQVRSDIRYLPRTDAADEAHRLDLYMPRGMGWPLLVFVHGGNWDTGDKNTRVGGADVYANLGRFYATQGIGVAVIDYRLQPNVDWRGQVRDVRAALQWGMDSIAAYGGRADALFLMGHSAGTHLGSYVAFTADTALQLRLRGVIAVSGAGLDMTDTLTWALGEDPAFYEKRFRGEERSEQWRSDASPILQLDRYAPPFLILHAGGEKEGLKRQSHLLLEALQGKGIPSSLVVVPGESHSRIVLTLSRPDKTAGPAIIEFVKRVQAGR